MLCTTSIGARMCVSLLDGMVKLYDAEDSHGTNAFDVGSVILRSCLSTLLNFRSQVHDIHLPC